MVERINPMTMDDVNAVLAVENSIYPFPWTRGNFIDSLTAGHPAWLLRDDDKLTGYIIMMKVLDEAHLLNVSVTPALQRSGCGSRLMRHAFERVHDDGAARVFLEVRRSNDAAQRLYLRDGFIRIGERRSYYPAADGREDAIVMARDL